MRLTNEDIQNIRRAYSEIGTYAGVARKLGFSPATVKKYTQEDNISDPTVRIEFNGVIPPVEELNWPSKEEIKKMGSLTESEIKEIEELWKEL